jgi:hypothetical protein
MAELASFFGKSAATILMSQAWWKLVSSLFTSSAMRYAATILPRLTPLAGGIHPFNILTPLIGPLIIYLFLLLAPFLFQFFQNCLRQLTRVTFNQMMLQVHDYQLLLMGSDCTGQVAQDIPSP